MARIFRSLLIAAVNAIQEFFAFATDNGESQVGDSVKLNDGMATSNYDWSAYPSDTEITGDYTQTGTIEKVKQIGDDFVYGMQEPEQDNKDVSINSGEMYYAYTNSNDESVYTVDDPISKETFILENATNNGCTDLGNGVYQCSPGNNITTSIGTDIQTASKWEICCKYNNQSASGYPTIFAPADSSYTQNPFLQLVSNKMYLFLRDVNGNDIIQGDTGYTLPSGFHLIQVGWTGSKYYMNVDGEEKWYYNSSVATKCNQKIIFLNLLSYDYWGYGMDMSQTSITIDNTTTNFGYFSNPSVLYENTGTTEFTPVALDPQPEFELGTGVIATDLQNGALVIPVHEIHNSMEMVIHFKTGSSWPNLCLCDSSKDGTQGDHSIYFQNYNAIVKAWLYSSSYTSGNADIANDYSVGFTLDLNTEYWVKTTWDGTAYKFYKSTNGNDYTIGSTLNSTVPINWNNNNLYLGNNYNTSVSDVYKNIYLDGTYIKIDGETVFDGKTAVLGIDYTNNGCTIYGYPKNNIAINNVLYEKNEQNNGLVGLDANISLVDNTTIQTATIISDQDATIETSANITTSNNDTVITDGSYHLFNLTIPTGMTPIIESSGISYQTNEMPLLLKSNTGVGFLLKDGNNVYYRNSWVINKDYDLHYQQINFSYPSGATVTCKVNNVITDLTPYCYAGDVITWTCDNAGVVTTGTYTVKYNSVDGNIQTIIIS